MPLEREFKRTTIVNGKLMHTYTALELSDPAADTGDHRTEALPFHWDGEVKKVWTDATSRWLIFTVHDVYHLKSGNGKMHEWNISLHSLPPPVYTYEAIANAVMPEGISPEEFLRDLNIRSLESMYRELRHPTARERLGGEFVDVMYQILDRIEGAMAELMIQEEDRRGN